ncbi:ATPase subunit of ABC transporter with duplicated ATPase domains [Micrococcus aloeverae]|uniref:ATPase subunit of ABC transporter with duplicated ATPase domains n=1 Tax=Micrococcus aloeverae TaxID=1391911 RepID=A0ABR6E1P7_9MICC|nr:ATPase subunit of ABC transporter with duplicated ATPase domains [Micrococcus aloeverae]
MAHLLGVEALHVEFPTAVVFDSVTLGVSEGDRIGIVGRNGDGKSTLLKLLAGTMYPNSGRVTRVNGLRVGVLDQRDSLVDEQTIGQAVVGDMPEHEWAGNARTRDVIAGLLTDLSWDAVIGSLSGGQRRRVQLAQLLVGDWDLICADEPTNHLDLEAIEQLEQALETYEGALLLVTHDRRMLDTVRTDRRWQVQDGRMTER